MIRYDRTWLTWSIPSGTSIGFQRFSVLIFPATFLRFELYNDRVSGVSNADRSIDCRRYAALLSYVRRSLIEILKTLTFRQDTTVLSSRNRCREIPLVACSCVIVQTSDLLDVIKGMKSRTDLDVLPVLHRQCIKLIDY